MKNNKIKLDALKVQSFVTEMASDNSKTAKGGVWTLALCESVKLACISQGAEFCSYDSC